MRVIVGGTFDILHKGHKQLLRTAFQTAGSQGFVYIGITTGKLAEKKMHVSSFEQRKTNLIQYLRKEKGKNQFVIEPIQDKYGPAIHGDFDAIVVSPETRPTAEEINLHRRQNSRKPLQIIEIPFVLADDSLPISSTRIRRKEIDSEGRILPRD